MTAPVIYELNTWQWLARLSRQAGRVITLGSVPASEWDRLALPGISALWLMGVWRRSPEARRLSLAVPAFANEHRKSLPDFIPDDVTGSPYAIRDYTVDAHFGGDAELAEARAALAQRGLKLILDFVPNHVSPDHPWLLSHPQYLIRGTVDDLKANPELFFEAGSGIFAHGRDPYFAPWADTAQLNAFDPGLRGAAAATLARIAGQCDGVRCDMAMLLLNDVFANTWQGRTGAAPEGEYWSEVVSAVRARYPEFLLLAEVYWDLEAKLLQLGFDFCYDKALYERLCAGDARGVRTHVSAPLGYQSHTVRFLENHDEPRAAATLSGAQERAAAIVVATLPGAKLYFDGQLTGSRTRESVHLGRAAQEPPDNALEQFYERLLRTSAPLPTGGAQWTLCEVEGWTDNQSCSNLLAWTWNKPAAQHLIIINYGGAPAQGRVRISPPAGAAGTLTLEDALNGDVFARSAEEIAAQGLFVSLAPWLAHYFVVRLR